MLKVKIIAHTPEPDKVVAQAGKLCYSAVGVDEITQKLTEEEIARYVNMLASIGHCYDDKTEVLTNNGFKLWEEVNDSDLIAAFNPEDKTFNGFEKPIRLMVQDKENEEMVQFKHKRGDLLITKGHKLYCSVSNSQYKRTHPLFQLIEADKVLPTGKKVYESPIRMTTCAENINNEIKKEDNWYRLFGFFIGDGYVYRTATEKAKGIHFHLKKKRKVKYLERICKACNLKIEKQQNDKYIVLVKDSDYDVKFFKDSFYNNNREKTFPNKFYSMSAHQYKLFIEGLLMSDGNYATKIKNNVYFTMSNELADKLQTLISLNGSMCTITKANNGCNKLYVSKKRLTNIMYNDSRTKHSNVKIVKYTGKVYCATISTGLLMVRRNGFICLCGNCSPLEHVSFTFAVEGISRVCTHQIVRHRIASYSQQSQRYVKLEQFEYIIPPAIENDPEAKKIFIETMERDQEAYDKLVNLLITDKIEEKYPDLLMSDEYKAEYRRSLEVDGKLKTLVEIFAERNKKEYLALEKQAIEDARYVFPNACETKIVVTMNARSLLHFFNVRCCNRAQWEIREMATEMLKECKKIAPALFKKAGPNCVYGKCGEGKMSCGHPRKENEFK